MGEFGVLPGAGTAITQTSPTLPHTSCSPELAPLDCSDSAVSLEEQWAPQIEARGREVSPYKAFKIRKANLFSFILISSCKSVLQRMETSAAK